MKIYFAILLIALANPCIGARETQGDESIGVALIQEFHA